MSSYTTSEVSVAPAVELMSAQTRRDLSDGLAMAGTAAAGAGVATAAVGVAAVTGVVLGTGWVLYAGGKLVYDEMKRVKKETEEKAERARLLEQQRCEMANEDRKQILQRCQELKKTWNISIQTAGTELSAKQDVKDLYDEIHKIEKYVLNGNADDRENDNLRDWEYLNQAAKHMETLIKDFFGNLKKEEERERIVSLLEKLHKIMQLISLDQNALGHDVKGRSIEEERLRKCRKRTEDLIVNLRYAIGKEAARELHMPVEQGDKFYLHQMFDGADQVIETLVSGKLSMEQKEYILDDFEKRLGQYETVKIQLDKKEERFACLYPVYVEVSEKMGEIPKNPTDFASLRELEDVMESMKKRVERMEQCAEIYRQIGKEAYICMAFDVEMEKLGYKIAERKQAQKFVFQQLKNGRVDNKTIPYYGMPDHSLTQFYHFGDSTCVQVIVREDGTTSMETFAVSEKESRDTVIREQKEHCKLNTELDKALRKNWFICSNLGEIIPPENVTVKNPKAADNPTYVSETTDWGEGGTQDVPGRYQVFNQ